MKQWLIERNQIRWLTCWLVVVMAIAWLAAGTASAQEKSRLDMVIERDKLIVVTMSTAPPFAFTDESGELVGFDIDIVRLAAQAILKDPNKVEFVTVTAEGRWPAIQSGRADVGVGGTTIYPDRALSAGFTTPYVDSGQTILVSKEAGIKSLEDLNQEKYIVANLSNPQMADRAKIYFPNAQILTFDTPSAQFLALRSGRAHAMQIDKPTADYFAAQHQDELEVLPTLLGVSQNNAFYLSTDDFKWWLWLETFARELRTGSMYPQYSEIYQKWFGTKPPPQKFYLDK